MQHRFYNLLDAENILPSDGHIITRLNQSRFFVIDDKIDRLVAT